MAAIQDKSSDFYRQFKAIVCGLDSIGARRWINAKVIELATSADPHFALLIDGGTEGLPSSRRFCLYFLCLTVSFLLGKKR